MKMLRQTRLIVFSWAHVHTQVEFLVGKIQATSALDFAKLLSNVAQVIYIPISSVRSFHIPLKLGVVLSDFIN